jgi:hypothetical protein
MDEQYKYAFRTETGKLAFSIEWPEKKYRDVIELDKLEKAFNGFTPDRLDESDQLGDIGYLSEVLNKNKFSIPAIYGLVLVRNGTINLLTENTDFRFFKNEIPEINNMIQNFPDEEKLDFYKFARALGCFSTEKILDKNGRETAVPLAQKASSLLAILLKTDGMQLRQISQPILFIAIRC